MPIDFEATCVAPAVVDLGFALCTHLGPAWGVKYETRLEFFQTYLKLSGQPASDDDAKALMLDAEINSLIGAVGLTANVWDAQVPLLRGAPHPTSKGTCEETEGPTG